MTELPDPRCAHCGSMSMVPEFRQIEGADCTTFACLDCAQETTVQGVYS